MKIHVCKFALIAVAALFLNSEWASCADNTTPPSTPTPGTPAATDTKSAENNPAGTATQTPASTQPDTKTPVNNANGTETQTTASGVGPKSSKKHHHKHKTTTTATTPTTASP
jgi:hypothetical protein